MENSRKLADLKYFSKKTLCEDVDRTGSVTMGCWRLCVLFGCLDLLRDLKLESKLHYKKIFYIEAEICEILRIFLE